MLAGDVIASSAGKWPAATAMIDRGRPIAYRELDRLANRVAQGLLAGGLGRGHCIAVLSPNCLEYSAIFFGAAKAGALQAHASTRYTEADLRLVLGRCKAEALFVDAELLPLARAARKSDPALRHLIVLGAAKLEGGEIGWDAFVAGQSDVAPTLALKDDDEFCVTFTGGTTGFPKGVVVNHRARTTVAAALGDVFAIEAGVTACLATPMFHVAGLFSWHLAALHAGATLAVLPKWDLAAYFAACRATRANQSYLVPTQVNAVVNAPDFNRETLPDLRLLNYGGSAMPVAVLDRAFEKLPGLAMLEHYGQSEAGAIAARPPELARAKPLSAGRPIPHLDFEFRDPAGHAVAHGGTGELVLRGPGIFKRYLDDPGETAKAFTADGWLKTGDIGYADADGDLFLVDRAKDMIIAGGENIYPAEIENALFSHPAVRECAVFAVPDAQWGEVPAAHVVLAGGAGATAQELIDHVAGRIARHKRPRLVEFVDALPKTAIGKVQKNVLRAPYWKGHAR